MKKFVMGSLSAALLSSLSLATHAQDLSADHLEARNMVKEFGGQLKPALKKAMKSGGPVAAIGVCHTTAPEIAKNLTEKHSPWKVNRVSLKPRGATATPDAWETETLQWFDAQIAAGANPKKLEKFEIVQVGGKEMTRYMKAVPTGGLCLTCHGSAKDIPAGVKTKLAELYPNDKATGYQKGQIRGAFSFSKVNH